MRVASRDPDRAAGQRGELVLIRLLGAERSAAVSFAQAWPEHRFVFVSDEPVIDGWDLPNVEFAWGAADAAESALPGGAADRTVTVCGRWASKAAARRGATTDLLALFARVRGVLGERVAPLTPEPPSGPWQAKGRFWHRPDTVVQGQGQAGVDTVDPRPCGHLFQPLIKGGASYIASGLEMPGGALRYGVFRIFSEALARYDVFQAGESVDDAEIMEMTEAALAALGEPGYFSLNWVRTPGALQLTSIRRVPREVLGTLRRGGVDVLAPGDEGRRLAAGRRFIVENHYSSYRRLEP